MANEANTRRYGVASDRDRGLYGKYRVQRIDRRDAPGERHHGCFYFILDTTHDPHALPALRAYAESCADTHPVLAADLKKMVQLWEHNQQLWRDLREDPKP